MTPFTLLVPNWVRCQIDSFYTLGAKLALLYSWCQIGSGAKLTLLHSWCQIGPVPNWVRCQIGYGAKLGPVPNCPPIILFNLLRPTATPPTQNIDTDEDFALQTPLQQCEMILLNWCMLCVGALCWCQSPECGAAIARKPTSSSSYLAELLGKGAAACFASCQLPVELGKGHSTISTMTFPSGRHIDYQ